MIGLNVFLSLIGEVLRWFDEGKAYVVGSIKLSFVSIFKFLFDVEGFGVLRVTVVITLGLDC